jgi:hypothetical protein
VTFDDAPSIVGEAACPICDASGGASGVGRESAPSPLLLPIPVLRERVGVRVFSAPRDKPGAQRSGAPDVCAWMRLDPAVRSTAKCDRAQAKYPGVTCGLSGNSRYDKRQELRGRVAHPHLPCLRFKGR